MHGSLFTLFSYSVPSYFVMLLVGFVLATAVGALWARRIGANPDVVVDLGIGMLIAGVVGARLLHVLADGYFWDYVHICTDPSQVAYRITEGECRSVEVGGLWDAARQVCVPSPHRDLWQHVGRCFAWADVTAGGLTYYGGFLGASVAAVFLLRRERFPFWRAADMAGMVVPLGLSFGRMGCLLAGCCFGAPVEGKVGLSFPGMSPASESQWKLGLLSSPHEHSLPVHPTQLYESAGALLIAAVLILWLHGRKRYDGQIFLAFVASYAVLRFIIEIWRRDDRGVWLLSTSQWIGLALCVAVALGHRWLAKRAARIRAASVQGVQS